MSRGHRYVGTIKRITVTAHRTALLFTRFRHFLINNSIFGGHIIRVSRNNGRDTDYFDPKQQLSFNFRPIPNNYNSPVHTAQGCSSTKGPGIGIRNFIPATRSTNVNIASPPSAGGKFISRCTQTDYSESSIYWLLKTYCYWPLIVK